MTRGQLSRSERDYVIAAAAKIDGVDERMLSRVFKLAPSRIHNIIEAMRALHEDLKRQREERPSTYREAFKMHSGGRKRERRKPEE